MDRRRKGRRVRRNDRRAGPQRHLRRRDRHDLDPPRAAQQVRHDLRDVLDRPRGYHDDRIVRPHDALALDPALDFRRTMTSSSLSWADEELHAGACWRCRTGHARRPSTILLIAAGPAVVARSARSESPHEGTSGGADSGGEKTIGVTSNNGHIRLGVGPTVAGHALRRGCT